MDPPVERVFWFEMQFSLSKLNFFFFFLDLPAVISKNEQEDFYLTTWLQEKVNKMRTDLIFFKAFPVQSLL